RAPGTSSASTTARWPSSGSARSRAACRSSACRSTMARAELEIASCRLDLEGLRRQRDRYAHLAADVDAIERTGESLPVGFPRGVDEALLRETIEVERGCCPFFRFELSGSERL